MVAPHLPFYSFTLLRFNERWFLQLNLWFVHKCCMPAKASGHNGLQVFAAVPATLVAQFMLLPLARTIYGDHRQ